MVKSYQLLYSEKDFINNRHMVYDFTVAGAGIVGLSAAYKLTSAFPDASVLVLEKENRVAAHQTGHNSGVIHSGIYYQPGSYKARNCVDGRHQIVGFCRENGILHDICGKVIVASDETEIPRLISIYKRGLENGIEGIRLIDEKELKEIEPYATGVRAIHVPCAGIADFPGVCEVLAQKLNNAGKKVMFEHPVQGVYQTNGVLSIQTPKGAFKTRHFINCTGLHSDRVARSAGVKPNIKIVPFRGEYYELTPDAEHKVKGLIYPVPDPAFPFLGVHLTSRVDGEVLIVGSPLEDGTAAGTGVVRVLTRNDGVWGQATDLQSPDQTAGAGFGSALTLSGGRLGISASGVGSLGTVYLID